MINRNKENRLNKVNNKSKIDCLNKTGNSGKKNYPNRINNPDKTKEPHRASDLSQAEDLCQASDRIKADDIYQASDRIKTNDLRQTRNLYKAEDLCQANHFNKKIISGIIKILVNFCLLIGVLSGCGRANREQMVDVVLEGGSGRASVETPALFSYETKTVRVVMSSANYDYIILDQEKYLPVNREGNSIFELPLQEGQQELALKADTTAMGTPHEIDYVLKFSWETDDAKQSMGSAEAQSTETSDTKEQDTQAQNTESENINEQNPKTENAKISKGKTKAWRTAGENKILPPEIEGIQFTEQKNERAEHFRIYNSRQGYRALVTSDGGCYLVASEGLDIPEQTPEGIQILQLPIKKTYVAASAVMSFYDRIGGLDQVEFTSLQEKEWFLPSVKKEMKRGYLRYAGKYSSPDYELLLGSGCGLAVESTMIRHTPEVGEKLRELGIPVLMDLSSLERDPLGRIEWIRVYGILTGKEKEAAGVFEEQRAIFDGIPASWDQKKSVVLFYLNANGQPVVRRKEDYLTRLIELAGGTYLLELGDDTSASPTATMTMEDFYLQARDADILIYNATIDGASNRISPLLREDPILRQFKAVKEEHVYILHGSLYQETASMGEALQDFYHCIHGMDPEAYRFLDKLEP